MFIEQILVERTLESTTVGRQFTKLVPFFLSSRGWQVNETNDGVNRRVRFLLHEHEAYKNFTATNVIYIEMLIYEANEISPIFIARVWTEGQESLLDEALLQRLAQQLINQLPAVKVVAE
ncbi:MAG: hypothetical protein A2087_09585 [Spirochaetes bacterium GWD1_61_31]|nr:MAG: hypothetical protein A2Y37_07180 [Spirochaetes bacterium GWB1_60_80]OHD39255.1 MAG: hypothetical protein A2087_09585 [Spirochaetes bacterium GWD1_61_31]OHD43658.1 MAG: hypothetical protein A2Y35_06375 [Spirochaetes bacterium GWE1_60_18]OHD59163.1 MAG: hypothetical protein A2Y32_14865 [Spirochaetes bacterium GWF1_60_12]